MAGCHGIKAKGHALAQQCRELNLLIASQARVRGLTALIGINEVSDDRFLEFLGEIPDIKRDAKLVADATRICGVFQ